MPAFSERTRIVRYLFGTADGRSPTLDLRERPDLAESFETNEWLAGLVSRQASFEIPPGPINTTDFVVLGAMAACFKTHSAIQLLSRHGYKEDAFARLRTLFEFALDLRYMRKDPAQSSTLAERWLDWAAVVQYRLIGTLRPGDDFFQEFRKILADVEPRLKSVLDDVEDVKSKDSHWYVDQNGKRRIHSHWSGKDTAEIAREVGWLDKYDWVFRTASEFIHPGMQGFTEFFEFEEPNLVTLSAGPSHNVKGIRRVLDDAATYFAHIALAWAETLGADEVASQLRTWMGAQDAPAVEGG